MVRQRPIGSRAAAGACWIPLHHCWTPEHVTRKFDLLNSRETHIAALPRQTRRTVNCFPRRPSVLECRPVGVSGIEKELSAGSWSIHSITSEARHVFSGVVRWSQRVSGSSIACRGIARSGIGSASINLRINRSTTPVPRADLQTAVTAWAIEWNF